jgi:hypothetical protein
MVLFSPATKALGESQYSFTISNAKMKHTRLPEQKPQPRQVSSSSPTEYARSVFSMSV